MRERRQLYSVRIREATNTTLRDKYAPKRETQKINTITASLVDGCVRVDSKGDNTSLRVFCHIGNDDDGGAERDNGGDWIGSIMARR